MDTDAEYNFRYVSPSIVQGERNEFALEYRDAQGSIMFGGLDHPDPSDAVMYFPSADDWDELHPNRKGQRELIKGRMLQYCRAHGMSYLERSLLRNGDRRRGRIEAGLASVLGSPRSKVDLAGAVMISLLLPMSVLSGGNPLNIGLWYYLLAPTLVLCIGVRLGAPPPYLSAASIAVAVSMLWYSSLGRPEDLPGLRHLASLPLALLGYVGGLAAVERNRGFLVVVLFGWVGWGCGLLVSHRFLCKAFRWCL